MNLEERLNKVATLNAIADEVFEKIPELMKENFIIEEDFLDCTEKCLNILQKIEVVKKTL